LTKCRYYALHRPLCWITTLEIVVPEIAQISGMAFDLLGEGSRQSSSRIRCDHPSVSYCGVLTFGVETFSELTAVSTERRGRGAPVPSRAPKREGGGRGGKEAVRSG